ncbi:biotin--[acetyl-CoA-carboxylase] ligase [Lacihabitans sp. CCS-44]|uniref:biotin--[acetyl-CoA-carboxylase] ligase n=1 Tax=Lacihabitans sp. CCS-44 TaxID=2487331 RepID=UPI0020CFD643|nr:biotin--[acetyl-CoA-carboxylase] ligase [Lacihabitans sp. CCS-44]
MVNIQPKTLFVGKNLVFLPSCHSTNDIASEIIQNKEFIDGTVIIADHQTAGKGQRGNVWESTPGENLLMSIILKTSFIKIEHQFNLSISVAVSVFEALNSFGVSNLSIKWPNDIYLNQKKIGGILIENSILGQKMGNSIIGIGLNIHQTKFENPRASSLVLEFPQMVFNRDAIAEKICEFLEQNLDVLKEGQTNEIQKKYFDNLFAKNEKRLFRTSEGIVEGKITGVTENGLLKIISQNTEKYYNIKEIEYLFDD